MALPNKLSLSSAIFINLNIMVSTGIFVNTAILSQKVGAAGFLLYPIVGIIMLPLIASVGKLLQRFPSGGFYTFGQRALSPFWGFISCWSYFFGKLASGSLMLYVSAIFLQQIFPSLSSLSSIQLSLILLGFFTFCNLLNMKVGVTIQSAFLLSKFIPIIFTIVTGLALFNGQHITLDHFIFENIPTTIPLILYCLAGFEAACSLSRKIENPKVNAPKAIYYSFAIIILLYALFQGLLYVTTADSLHHITTYKDTFPFLVAKAQQHFPFLHAKVGTLLSLCIGISALGGSYGVLFSNTWNLFTLAENKHTFFPHSLTSLNSHYIPMYVVLIEALICTLFLISTQGFQVPLQQTASFGVTIAYTVSALSLFMLYLSEQASWKECITPALAIVTTGGFIASCIASFMQNGIASLYLFLGILLFGIMMYVATQFMYKKA